MSLYANIKTIKTLNLEGTAELENKIWNITELNII